MNKNRRHKSKGRKGTNHSAKSPDVKIKKENAIRKVSIIKQSKWAIIKNHFFKFIRFYGLLGLIALGITYYSFFKSFKTEKQKFEETKFVKGLLIPDNLFEAPDNEIIFIYGDNRDLIKNDQLLQGYSVGAPVCATNDSQETSVNFSLRLLNNRILVSCTFRDLESNEVVGIIKDNDWILINNKALNYFSDDKTLEVLDNTNNVIFRLQLLYANEIVYEGYNVTDNFVSVYSNHSSNICIPKSMPNYKQQALKYIKDIVPQHSFFSQ